MSLSATEWIKNTTDPPLTLYHADRTLWTTSDASPSGKPPAVLPFHFLLTNDLPQCIHLRTSQLSYSLVATLYHHQGVHLRTSVHFHPRRYMEADPSALYTHANVGPHCMMPLLHGDSTYSLSPLYWRMDSPIQVFFRLEQSVIRLCDPIQLQVHIPPPSRTLVNEKGIKLQNVSAKLIRAIQSHPAGELYSDVDLLERIEQNDSCASCSLAPAGDSLARASPTLETCTVTTSGKSCRFHSQHAVHLRLALHPGSALGCSYPTSSFEPSSTQHNLDGDQKCESISQDTGLHNIRFILIVRVVIRGEHGENLDIVTRRIVKILPSPPVLRSLFGDDMASHEKQSRDKQAFHGSDSMAALFSDAVEYDGYDDTMSHLPSSGAVVAVEDMSCAPLCVDSVPNERTSVLGCDDEAATPPVYQTVLPADESDESIPDEELPDFDEAAMQPPESLVHTWNSAPNFSGPSGDAPIPMEELLSPSFQPAVHLPPSYIDSAQTQDTMVSPSTETLPPAYAPRPIASDSTPGSNDPIFPPLYEA